MAYVLLLKTFAVGDVAKKVDGKNVVDRSERKTFTADRKKFQQIPDKYLTQVVGKNYKGEDVMLLKPGINGDYMIPEMVWSDKEFPPTIMAGLKEQWKTIKSQPEKVEDKKQEGK